MPYWFENEKKLHWSVGILLKGLNLWCRITKAERKWCPECGYPMMKNQKECNYKKKIH